MFKWTHRTLFAFIWFTTHKTSPFFEDNYWYCNVVCILNEFQNWDCFDEIKSTFAFHCSNLDSLLNYRILHILLEIQNWDCFMEIKSTFDFHYFNSGWGAQSTFPFHLIHCSQNNTLPFHIVTCFWPIENVEDRNQVMPKLVHNLLLKQQLNISVQVLNESVKQLLCFCNVPSFTFKHAGQFWKRKWKWQKVLERSIWISRALAFLFFLSNISRWHFSFQCSFSHFQTCQAVLAARNRNDFLSFLTRTGRFFRSNWFAYCWGFYNCKFAQHAHLSEICAFSFCCWKFNNRSIEYFAMILINIECFGDYDAGLAVWAQVKMVPPILHCQSSVV